MTPQEYLKWEEQQAVKHEYVNSEAYAMIGGAIPHTNIALNLAAARQKGFEQVCRYISGLLLSPNKTLEGIHAQQIWEEGDKVNRRGMHAVVFEAPWNSEGLMPQHREVVAADHRGKGKDVIGIDWTLSHHERGGKIFGVKQAYDYVARKMSRYQTVVTAVIANREVIDSLHLLAEKALS
jgi:hypothetical protein